LFRWETLEVRVTPAFPFPTLFTGGVHVASADVNGDGFADIVAAAGPGGGPHVEVFSGQTGKVTLGFYAYDAGFHGGVYVATGDVNGDGVADIVTGPGEGGGPQVKVFSGTDGSLLETFMAYDPAFTGGVRVAVGDVNGDGRADIITAAGPGGGAHVKVFSGKDGSLLESFLAYDPTFTGGAFVAAGDINGDGKADIITGAGAGGGPHVKVFDGATGQDLLSFFAYDPGFTGGVTVAAGPVGGGSTADIITGAGPGGGPHVKVIAPNGQLLESYNAYEAGFTGGVFVADPDLNADGHDDIVTGAGNGGATRVRAFSGSDLSVMADFKAFPAVPGGPFSTRGTPIDRTPPVVQITAPPPAQVSTNPTIGGTVTDAGGSGVQSLTASVDGGQPLAVTFNPSTGSFTFTTSLATNGSADGAHTVSFVALDKAGNTAQPVSASFTLKTNQSGDHTPPVIEITDQIPAQISENTVIHGTATDTGGSGVQLVTASLDGRPAQSLPFSLTSGRFAFPTGLATDGSADGPHTVSFVAQDVAGNVSQPTVVSFTLNTRGPTVNFDLDAASDTGVKGNQRTDMSTVTLTGQTTANATVKLVQTGAQTTAGNDGTFSFTGVTLTPGPNTFTIQATDDQNKTGSLTRVITLNSAPTVAGPVTNFQVAQGAQDSIFNLPTIFSDVDVNTLVHFDTNAGGFDVELFDQQTPLTVANFLDQYVTAGRYNSSIFHRNAHLTTGQEFVLQGGAFRFQSSPATLTPIKTASDPTVKNEPLLSNQQGTIAMAKLPATAPGGGPDSATSEFFFNLGDNSRNSAALDSQNGGFTAFGTLRGTGQQVVNQLAAIQPQDRSGFNSALDELPLQNYPQPPNGNFPTDTTAANYAFINSVAVTRKPGAGNVDALTFAVVSNSNANLVTATITSGDRLVLHYNTGQPAGAATIVLKATDKDGDQVTTNFTVTVA
jgi:cyclophilin family peptidyl-prolyl cis-trans isomerase